MVMKKYALLVCLGSTLASSAFAGVVVTAPSNGASVGTTVQFVATATAPACSKGVASIGIYTAPFVLAYFTAGTELNKELTLSPGTYNTMVQEWDNCGSSSATPITIQVGGSGGSQAVRVSAPANGANVTSPVNFVATATTNCSKGIASMGVYTAPGQLAYTASGSSLNANLPLANGTYSTMVQEWDNCGGSTKTPITITVGGGGGGGRTFSNLHSQNGWTGYALEPPGYGICNSCKSSGPQTTWSWTPHVSSPSMSGDATSTTIGGHTVFSDVLWNNHLIGDFSSQGLPDTSHTLVPSLHYFTYDVWFYVGNVEISQALEFDINQFFGGKSFIWGHECRVAGGHEWDTWNNGTQQWVPSGVLCNPISNAWNHLILQTERTSDDKLLFKSITLNGKTANINRYDSPTPRSWYGVTINYQIDGNRYQQPYAIVLDKLNFTVQ